MEVILEGETISYVVRRSTRARYVRMTIGVREGLVVTVPSYGGTHLVESFLREKATWILKHLRRMKKFDGKKVLNVTQEEYEKNKNAFLNAIVARIEFFNSLYQFSYKKISIRNQTSLWGSCTRAGNLQFNYKLSHLSAEAIDYVIVHELCHLKEHNHGPRFWKLVAKTIPNYKAIRKSLHGYVMQEG